MVTAGVVLFLATAAWLLGLFLRSPQRRRYPHYGYLGLLVIVIAEIGMFRGRQPVSTFFTPIVWTGYIAAVDAAVLSLSGRSLLRSQPGEFLASGFLSVPLWLVFEAYNVRLRNWVYVGLPANAVLRCLGYTWSFATIWPAILETSQLLRAAGLWRQEASHLEFSRRLGCASVAAGALMLVVPLVLPLGLAPYSFGLVWLGFIFLLEPVNFALGAPSIVQDLRQGRRARPYSLLAAGALCGVFWEFWNYWATAKWIYVFPILQDFKLFEMPVPGFLGFPLFALELLAMYSFLTRLVGHVAEL